jgi:hypothetical protein
MSTPETVEAEKWEDLSPFRMDQEAIDEVLALAPGCVVTWVAKNGQPMGVWVSHVVMDGELWVTTTGNRSKTRAWKRDPRTTAVFGVPGIGSVTLVGKVDLHDDAAERTRFLETLWAKTSRDDNEMRASWLQHMNTDDRLVGPVRAEKYITFDERKLAY